MQRVSTILSLFKVPAFKEIGTCTAFRIGSGTFYHLTELFSSLCIFSFRCGHHFIDSSLVLPKALNT